MKLMAPIGLDLDAVTVVDRYIDARESVSVHPERGVLVVTGRSLLEGDGVREYNLASQVSDLLKESVPSASSIAPVYLLAGIASMYGALQDSVGGLSDYLVRVLDDESRPIEERMMVLNTPKGWCRATHPDNEKLHTVYSRWLVSEEAFRIRERSRVKNNPLSPASPLSLRFAIAWPLFTGAVLVGFYPLLSLISRTATKPYVSEVRSLLLSMALTAAGMLVAFVPVSNNKGLIREYTDEEIAAERRRLASFIRIH